MKLPLVSVGLCAVASMLAQATQQVDESGLDGIVRRMKFDNEGLLQGGLDGILRSFDKRGNVIDSARLDSEQLMVMARALNNKELASHWQNVNSSEVDENEVWSPEKHLLPRRFTDPEEVEDAQMSAAPLHHNLIRASKECQNIPCQVTLQCRAFNCRWCFSPPPGYGRSHCMK
ncbi:hypothetical protein ACJ72_06804 [Emergomyces africanus]|uniref:Uncharacterized protein n=1 Tax=Emergomyces africanus TaxID=1955775 RepID=A0A1B7NPZ0_9EURO|nr:hypothetical protein ACJ72_06804 [Emergomyces africanus]